ncbi:DUF5691 domain-containing protein [Dyella silvatica]|uniref:DUF5691 domain-containing protein n=1 Tax=Dyella silvatica TaxID=2992128 RepID=UPI00225AF649|nr:DUF5691 domain-containing protein [Dyella silvatica]
MTSWLKQALIGVDQAVPGMADGAIGAWLEQPALTTADAALDFSRKVGALAACRLAAVTLEAAPNEAWQAAPEDPQRLAQDHPWRSLCNQIFADGSPRLQYEACLRLAYHEHHLPWSVLPSALERGLRNTALRPALLPVLGARGHWLARQRTDWQYAATHASSLEPGVDDGDRIWQEGSIEQRLAYFRQLRGSDPQQARDLFLAQMSEWRAKERGEFVSAFAIGLQPLDTVVLEPLLKDRSNEVRQSAAMLLARLPESAHARHLSAWLAQLVTSKRGLLQRTWQCDAPQAVDPAWAGAMVEAVRPQHDVLGERAWWLYQLVRQVPLSWWVAHTGMSPTALIGWAGKTDWSLALYRGWRQRVGASDPVWIEAMLSSDVAEFTERKSELLALLPVAQRERYWPRSLDQLQSSGALNAIVGAFASGETLTLEYSVALLPSLRASFESDQLRYGIHLRAPLLELAGLLHPDSLHQWQPLLRRDDLTAAMTECLHEFERIVAARLTLYALPDRPFTELR